jgi:hypothetical protein
LAQRNRRKRRPARPAQRDPASARTASPEHADPRPAQPSRSEQRDAAVRARLDPLDAGERPPAIVIATIVATALAIANLVAYAVGVKIQGKTQGPGVLLFPAVMAIAAVGMWRLRYWAVLGFEALLALIVIVFALFLVRAGNIEAVAVCLVVIGSGGWLFFKLVRAMARIQMPTREPPG